MQDVDDEMVLDAAINGRADVIVTHNLRDFLTAASRFNLRVVSPASFIEEPTSPLLHRALSPEDAAYFAQAVRRIAAILLLGPAFDASYRKILPTSTGLPAPTAGSDSGRCGKEFPLLPE